MARRTKLFFVAFVVSFSLGLFSVSSSAEEYDPWGDNAPDWYRYGFNLDAFPDSFYIENTNAADALMTKGSIGSITRTIDGVTYSAVTQVYNPDRTLYYSSDLFFYEIDPSCFPAEDGKRSDSFTDLDIIFCINVYGNQASLSDFDPYCYAWFGNVTPGDSSDVVYDLRLQYTPIASIQYSAASVTYFFKLSYHGDRYYINDYPGQVGIDVPNSYLGFIFGSSPDQDPRVPFVYNLIDIDVGVVDARIGDFIDVYMVDIWGDMPHMPQVNYPTPTISGITPYESLFESTFILNLFIPVMVVLIGFFTLRTIVWKDV